MKHSIKREQSHARMSFAECENQRSLAEGESNVRATLKHMKLSFNLILTLAAMLTMAQTAWAVTETRTVTYRLITGTQGCIKANIGGTEQNIITPIGNHIIITNTGTITNSSSSHETENLQISANINGKIKQIEFTKIGKRGITTVLGDTYYWGIDGMKYGNADAVTETGNDEASFTFTSNNGISGNPIIKLGALSSFTINSNCDLVITYEPSAAPVHTHNFSFNAVGNTLTATCGHSDGLACSLADADYKATLTLSSPVDTYYRPYTTYSAKHNLTAFNALTGLNATATDITYVNNTTGDNLGTAAPTTAGNYTASVTVTVGGTDYTLTTSFHIYRFWNINNIYPQFNISNDEYASTTTGVEGQTVTITFTPKFGETLTGVTVTGATTNMSIGSGITSIGNNKYTFTMPTEEVNIGATFSISEDDFAETGENEYTIKTANGWGWFCFTVSYDLAPDGFSGKTVKLAKDVESAEIAGKSGHPFKGTFDGQNHTLTFNRTAAEDFCAPFHYINGATISNLHVDGTITGGNYERLSGLVGHSEGNITIKNCRVSTEISTTVSGSALHGGVIGDWNGTNAICTVTGCVYDGLIYNPNEAGVTTSCHGFIGWDYGNYGTITFTDCLSAPAAYGTDKYALGGNCFTFVFPNSEPTLTYNMTNCYYTSILGKRQGRPAATTTVAPGNLGNATTNHGIVDGYKNGFLYDGNYYTPKYGDAVVEYRFNDWNERADVTINGTNNQETGVSVVGVNITEEVGNIKSVTYNRPFNTAQAATVILPFSYICNGSEGGKFFGFKEVVYDEGQHKWVCTMVEPGNTAVTSLTANTPYLFMPDDATTMTFPNISSMTGGVVTLQTTTANDGLYGGATTDAAWNFHGTYKGKSWAVASNDYGFAAQSGTEAGGAANVEAGQFVRFTTGAFIKPMRCYLSYVGTEAPAPAPGLTRAAATDDLPQSITVRLVSRNGETTAIGEIDTKTGEVTFDSEAWYTLGGVRLSGKPSKKGLYINNGKKVIVK